MTDTPDLPPDVSLATKQWKTLEPGRNLAVTHDLDTLALVVQATASDGTHVPIEVRVVDRNQINVTIADSVPGPVTLVLIG